MSAPRVLFVCLGNICRSPLAQGVFEHHANLCGLDVVMDSAGTAGYHIGKAPDVRAIRAARSFGFDISAQRARQLQVADFNHFDQIYTMDASNYQAVFEKASTPAQRAKVKMVMSLTSQEGRGGCLDVPDSYYGTGDDFDAVVTMLSAAAKAWISAVEGNEVLT